MKKRLLSYILTVLIVTTLIPGFSVASAATNINIGDYIEMGEYYGEPILWRCVDIDENGPLILSDKIICLKPFDAAGDNISGSHGWGAGDGYGRRKYGSDYWFDSNICCWLNSRESAGNVTWLCGNPPDNDHVNGGYNDYADEAGFKTNFSLKELSRVKAASISDEQTNTVGSYKFFLLSYEQLESVCNNSEILGEYYNGYLTERAIYYSEYKEKSMRVDQTWEYWLRSTCYPGQELNLNGFVFNIDADCWQGDGLLYAEGLEADTFSGVRPAFYFDETSSFPRGDGTKANPYRLMDRQTNYGNKLLNAMNATPATEYNNELAEIAAQLSLKTYDDGCGDPTSIENYLHYDLGFDTDKIWSKNYGGSFAFTIAKMDCPTDDADEILVIAAQGTTLQLKEMFGDAFYGTSSENRKFFGGYYPYQVAVAFYSEIVSFDYKNSISLYNLTEQNKRYKILLTGHSLGGAAANLVAANLTAGRHIGAALDYAPDVYCYTFGAIDSIDVDSPVTDGYKNIHNVYNEMDTLSPTQYGDDILKNGTGSRNGKFGVIEAFEYDYRSDGDKGKPDLVQMIDAVNHGMDKYLEAVQSGKVENSIFRPNSKAAQEWAANYMVEQLNGYLVAGCPVDVDVYCDGELVGRVVNNTVDESVTSIPIIVEDDIKFIFYSNGQKLDLKINAYDEGTMTFYSQDLAGAGNVKMMTNVALTDGKTMTSEVSGDIDTSETQLLVVDENNEVVSKVLSDGTETEVNKDEIVFGNTDLINTGEKILISSVIENFTAEESEPMDIIAALYYDGIMIDFGMYRDVIIPVNREIRKNFELKCQGKYQDDVSKLKVKLFYWNNISQLTPIRGVSEFLIEQPVADVSEQVE